MSAEIILGIDLGTTNSEAAIIRDGQPVMVRDEDGDPILPSVVGLDAQGPLIVGRPARNHFVVAPERTVSSIKRKMGEETTVSLGDQTYSPQEISAIILRTLKQRAEKSLGHEIKKAVITVPAFFGDAQRAATREAGELAGLEVVRIINEPTASVLTYDPHPPEMERLLVYDLGGGTFDVSIAQVEAGVVEILASHGDTHLGGDDFDQRFLTYVADRFQSVHGIDLRNSPISRSRLLRAVEDAKKLLSVDAVVQIEQEFITEKNGVPLHLKMEVDRHEYEELIEPLLAKTLTCVDRSLNDALLVANQINKVLLVGGATRTPLVQRLLRERLGRPVHAEIEPDLAVAMGAAVQGGLIAGVDVGAVLVDITPHTIGVEAVGMLNGVTSVYKNVPVIQRNTPLPARRTETFTTVADGQQGAHIRIFQGDNQDTRYDTLIGSFKIEGLADVDAGNQIVVRLDLDLNGILNVTATERLTGLSRKVTIDNATERFKANHRVDAVDRLEAMFDSASSDPNALAIMQNSDLDEFESSDDPTEETAIVESARELMASAERMLASANAEDAAELTAMLTDLRRAVDANAEDDIGRIVAEVEDLVFYLKEN